MPFWTYMLHCRGGYFYVGHTDDIEKRILQHQSGSIPGFTADHLPVELVWSDWFQTRDDAKAAERQIKGWPRAKKLALIRGDWDRISMLAKGKSGPSTSLGSAVFANSVSPNPVPAELVEALSFSLRPHPDTPCSSVRAITVAACMDGPDSLSLTFRVLCIPGKIKFPAGGNGARRDRLWEHTCFEMFSQNVAYDAYEELNLSPSTDWASYDFDSYRYGMRPTEIVLPPSIEIAFTEDSITLKARAALAEGAGPWRVGFSAVIEEEGGHMSYWALAHAPGKPDFHHPACFTATLPAAQPA